MIELHQNGSGSVREIRMALLELGLPYEIRQADIIHDHFEPAYPTMDPDEKVPAIVDHSPPGGSPAKVFGGAAVLLYLAEKTGRLLPADPAARWEAISWTFWDAVDCRVLEDRLAGREYLAGEFSIADLAAFARVGRPAEDDAGLSGYPAVRGWYARIACRQSARATAGNRSAAKRPITGRPRDRQREMFTVADALSLDGTCIFADPRAAVPLP